MFWTLIRKELLSSLLTLRLAVSLGFTVILCVLTTLIGSLEYSRRVKDYQEAVRREQEALDQATVYNQIDLDLLFPPQPLSILCRGISETAGYTVGIYVSWRPFPPMPIGGFGGAGGDAMRTLTQIDFATAVALVLSFLAVVLGFDGICGERERGTLRQVLANPVPRYQIVLAKLIGGCLSLWIPLTVAFGLALLVLQANPEVHFAGDDWVRLALFFFLSCLFLGQVFALSLMVSAFVQRSATSLAICLFAWLVSGVGYASVLPSLARYGAGEEIPYQETLARNDQVWARYNQAMADWEAKNPPPGPAYLKAWEQNGRIRYGHPRGYAWRQERNAFDFAQRLENTDELYRIWEAQFAPLARQALLVDAWSILSPFTNYQVLSCRIARTTLDDRFYLRRLSEQFRQTYLSYLQGRNAFASRRWFTDDPEDQEPMIPDPERITPQMLSPDSPFMQERLAWIQEQERRAASQRSRQLNLSDLPKLGDRRQRPLADSLPPMIPGLSVLILSLGLAVLATLWRFQRYDPQ